MKIRIKITNIIEEIEPEGYPLGTTKKEIIEVIKNNIKENLTSHYFENIDDDKISVEVFDEENYFKEEENE